MSLKEFSLEVTTETENQVIQHLKEVESLLPFLVDLSVEERIRLAKMSRKNVDFVDRGLLHAKNHPQYVSPFIDADDLAKAVALRDYLYRVNSQLRTLYDNLKDTIMLVESETYAAARVFYKSVKAAAREGGADAERIARDLAYHYKKKPADEKESNAGEPEPAEG